MSDPTPFPKGKPKPRTVGKRVYHRIPIDERFWPKVQKGAPDECWTWCGAVVGRYGNFDGQDRRLKWAHRVAYELTYGSIPDGLHIDHLCRNTLCVNPAHLEAVTQAENNRRAAAAATTCRSGLHPVDGDRLKDGRCAECRRERERRYVAQRRGREA